MKTLLFTCCRGAIIMGLICSGLNSCSGDENILLPYAESTAILKQNTMDTVMFHVLANKWILSFDDTAEAILSIIVHPGYTQPGPINPYGSKDRVNRGYEVLTSFSFKNSPGILLLEGHQPGDYPYYYFFKLYPSIGIYPRLEFDLLYYINAPSIIEGVFYNRIGEAMPFTGTN